MPEKSGKGGRPMSTKVNVGRLDRVVRGGVGLLALALGVWGKTPIGDAWDLLGTALLATAVSGFCLVYRVLGIATVSHARQAVSPAVRS
jgi:hypothetical protein